MSILVCGGAGYIGSHTCVELIQAGYDIVVVARTRAIYGRYAELEHCFVQQMKKLGMAAPKGDKPQ